LIILLAIPGIFLLTPRLRYTNISDKPALGNIFSMWSNFDGVKYLSIAEHGYNYERKSITDYAIFPVFPWTIRSANIFGSFLTSGLILPLLFFALALYFLYKLILLDFKPKTAKLAIYLILIFPTAFFFGSVYSESLFLLLLVLSFYSARRKNFFFACAFAALASATRITGIFLWPAIVYEFWLANKNNPKKFMNPDTLWLILPPLGLLSFMRFQFLKTGDPFLFISLHANVLVQPVEKLILIHQVYFRYFKMLIFTDHMDPLFFTIVLELICASMVLSVLIFSFKKIRFSYWLFSVLSFILPTFTGTF
jgi:hypothetical protein